jgi:hypothetical protein
VEPPARLPAPTADPGRDRVRPRCRRQVRDPQGL